MNDKEILTAVIVDAQRAGLSGRAFAEYLAERILLAGGRIDREQTLALLLTAPTLGDDGSKLRSLAETIRIRYMAACGVEKEILGDVLNLLEGCYGKESCF